MTESKSISIIVCGPSMVCATALMNANSVAPEFETEVNVAARRLAIFLHQVKVLPVEVDVVQRDFYAHLDRNWEPYVSAVKQKTDFEYIAYADGLGYLARFHAILYELKSFLDIFARLICRLVSSKPGPNGFNKGKVGDVDVSGGKLINWLAGHTIESLPNRDALVHLLTSASHEWITEAIRLRDTLSHYRDIPGFRHMRISVSNGPKNLKRGYILPPEMPGGEDLSSFTSHLRDRLCVLLSEVLPMAPGVKSEMNEKWATAARYLNEK
jgi:hypothetical protein